MKKQENTIPKTPLIHEKKIIWLDARSDQTARLLTKSSRGFFLLVGQPHTGAGWAMECLVHQSFAHAQIHRLPDSAQEKSLQIIKVGDDMYQTQTLTWPAPRHDRHRSRVHDGTYTIADRTIRSLIHAMSHSSLAGTRVIVIDHMQRLNEAASNAFLKMLEELPDHTIVIASCWGLDTILPTIASRATIIPYPTPDKEQTTAFLLWILANHNRLKEWTSLIHSITLNDNDTLGCETLFGSMIGYRYDCVYDFLWWWSETPSLITLIATIRNAYQTKHALTLSKTLVTLPDHRRDHGFAALARICSPEHLDHCIQARKRLTANVSSEHTAVWLAATLCQ